MKRKPRIPAALVDWLLASTFAILVTAMGRMGWELANVVKADPLNDLAFQWFAGPVTMLFLALIGNSDDPGYPTWRQQCWASMLMGASAIVALELQLELASHWWGLLALPTAWWFVRFYRVKRDRPGAIEAFQANRTVLAIQHAYEGILDNVYEPGWRDRKDEIFLQQEVRALGRPGHFTEAVMLKRQKGGPDRRVSQQDLDEVHAAHVARLVRESEDRVAASLHGGGKMRDPNSP